MEWKGAKQTERINLNNGEQVVNSKSYKINIGVVKSVNRGYFQLIVVTLVEPVAFKIDKKAEAIACGASDLKLASYIDNSSVWV